MSDDARVLRASDHSLARVLGVAASLGVLASLGTYALCCSRFGNAISALPDREPNESVKRADGELVWKTDVWKMPWGRRSVIELSKGPGRFLTDAAEASVIEERQALATAARTPLSRWISIRPIAPLDTRGDVLPHPIAYGVVDQVGWPWPAFEAAYVDGYDYAASRSTLTPLAGAIGATTGRWPGGIGAPFRWPLRICVPPFVANLAVMTGTSLGLCIVFQKLFSSLRRRAGRCPDSSRPI